MKALTRILVFCLAGIATGCATQRPVLYPNAKYKQAGEQAAQADIADCDRLARGAGASPRGDDNIARSGGTGAAVGGATGAVAGAIGHRNVLDSAVRGAAVGAAGGAAYGATRSGEPGSVYKGFMDRCLRDKGYDVIGWQ